MASAVGINVVDLGRKPFVEVWESQKSKQAALINGSEDEWLLLCEHFPPVITVGRSGNRANIIAGPEKLIAGGTQVIEIERGGDVTWHGPGQLTVYPILNLSWRRTNAGWYMRSLEEVVIRTLADFNITGQRLPGKAGVWIDSRSKIASLGVRISHWCTLHGLALNVFNCRAGFEDLHPCGFKDIIMTSMEEELFERLPPKPLDLAAVKAALTNHFLQIFLRPQTCA